MALAAPGLADCFHKHDDPTETIREDEDTGGLVWEHRGKRVEFETGGGGTGIGYRIAYDAQGNGFRYEFVGDDLIFGDVRYVRGCN
jgi:hypothetical protein